MCQGGIVMVLRFFRTPAFGPSAERRIHHEAQKRLGRNLTDLQTETCFYVEVSSALNSAEHEKLTWLLAETFAPQKFSIQSFLEDLPTQLEAGPRMNFESAFSSTAVGICRKCGIKQVTRLERSVRFGLSEDLSEPEAEAFLRPLHDRMTQERYFTAPQTFTLTETPQPVQIIGLLREGKEALRKANKDLGLAMDEQDLELWFDLFISALGRNSTDVELFHIGQANSEHSRHGWFRGIHEIDGVRLGVSPMDIVRATWEANPNGSKIAFADNSSAIAGHEVGFLRPAHPSSSSYYIIEPRVLLHPTLTAETHNHPTLNEPFEGAATGGGGRIRDNQEVGTGGLVIVGGAGYCTANLRIPEYEMPWEKNSWQQAARFASPLEIIIRASDGASHYGNCFGEPLIYGFTRTFEGYVGEEYRGWFKPIMYSVGAGAIRDEHLRKATPATDMLIILLGGPGYRIGVGGGAASSMVGGANDAQLDFASVQRGNPEMENRVDRVVRSCVSMGKNNPILSGHDLGAGGTCNALPEIADPAGARIDLRRIPVADPTLSTREIWGNESQERNVVLVHSRDLHLIDKICERESCPYAVVGRITGDGELVVHDEKDNSNPVELPLDRILGKLPQKTFRHVRSSPSLAPLTLETEFMEALDLVLRLPSVASKRFLTNKVDRSVTGLVAQQQCVGPNHLPISDYAVRADSQFGLTGCVMSLGEQPIKGLINPEAMGRLSVSEALLNMSGAVIDDLQQVKASGNWMWAAKFPGEGSKLIDAAMSVRDIMIELGLAIDGGKDSLSMAVGVEAPDGETKVIKAPGEFVVALYAATSDITRKVTPDLKRAGNTLVWIDLGFGKSRMGGSALAQVTGQLGDESPDVDNVGALARTFQAVQQMVRDEIIESVHDVSDGGLITIILEMAFAGNRGAFVQIESEMDPRRLFFAEEPGVVLEVKTDELALAASCLEGLPCQTIGHVGLVGSTMRIEWSGVRLLDKSMVELRAVWEETSNRLERLQANPDCIAGQEDANRVTTPPPYRLRFAPTKVWNIDKSGPNVALIREEGTNGDREMAATLLMAGFNVKDVNMQDLLEGTATLDEFRGLVIPGGFSFGDVLDSGKGWAGVIRFNPKIAEQFDRFRHRPDTFSLGVCNGCQLMALLGWMTEDEVLEEQRPRFITNQSGRFESRFVSVRIERSPAIMFAEMEGSILGVWSAHGEGYAHFPSESLLTRMRDAGQIPMVYVDDRGNPTDRYPYNPNGSPYGIAGLCSADGRHTILMPHPERTIMNWQWPWMPKELMGKRGRAGVGPWLTMFSNARKWCEK